LRIQLIFSDEWTEYVEMKVGKTNPDFMNLTIQYYYKFLLFNTLITLDSPILGKMGSIILLAMKLKALLLLLRLMSLNAAMQICGEYSSLVWYNYNISTAGIARWEPLVVLTEVPAISQTFLTVECNIFCCDCDGGCRQEKPHLISNHAKTSPEIDTCTTTKFAAIDRDGDGIITE
jgi:hypothetical protein